MSQRQVHKIRRYDCNTITKTYGLALIHDVTVKVCQHHIQLSTA